jgi:predicted oxidoreductase
VTDIVVVGAGGAGVAAAIEAAQRRATVAVFDTAPTVGGTAMRAGGGTCIAGSPRQRELGIEDSLELALADWTAMGGSDADAEWAERYLAASAGSLYEELAALGVRWGDVRWNEGNSVPRWHAPVGGGRAVMRALEAHARSMPTIRWFLETRITDLLTSGGRVVGVAGEGPGGPIEQRANSVVIACGGFSSDASLVRTHGTHLADVPRVLLGGGPGARGWGHALLSQVGAAFVNLDVLWMYPYGTPDPHAAEPDRGLAIRDIDGDIWVNLHGARFHDESRRGGASGTPALLTQPEATCWSIIDAEIAARMTVADPAYREGAAPIRAAIEALLESSTDIERADDLVTLGGRIGLDGRALARTVSEHNLQRARVGRDEFGRDLADVPPLTSPPFTAIRFLPLTRKNLGGVRTDRDGQVVGEDGRAIGGLFAAGEVAGMAGGHINGRGALEGTMFGPSLFSGGVAGQAMAA